MKYAHIEENTNKLLGWYDNDIHTSIPAPNIEVTEEQWQIAIDNGHNKVNADGTTEVFDFRTDNEKLLDIQSKFRLERNNLLSQVDIEINIGIDNGIDVSSLRTYRQELRDATVTWVLPTHP